MSSICIRLFFNYMKDKRDNLHPFVAQARKERGFSDPACQILIQLLWDDPSSQKKGEKKTEKGMNDDV
jgi:hypothetical protein